MCSSPNNTYRLMTSALTAALMLLGAASASGVEYPRFDRGPDKNDPMQQELVEILDDLPNVPGISRQLQVLVPSYKDGQKMRPDFGAMPLRGFLLPNSISVLVIGQDATHIAEGANRPGIAGFGGRVHDMLRHFGIIEGVLFTNLYVNTISGQYGSRNTPVVQDGKSIVYTNVIENRQWLMTHEGPYAEWRNRFLSWVIRNNRESLKMVMLLGQAGKDAGASLVNYLGGHVGPRPYVGDGSQFEVPWFKMVSSGGNNEWAVPVTKDGQDIAELLRQDDDCREALKAELLIKKAALEADGDDKEAKVLARRIKALDEPLDYRDGGRDYGVSTANAEDLLTMNFDKAKELMVFSNGGPQKNGVLYPQQFGGWDLDTMTVKGKRTRSIKGLRIPCNGSTVNDCEGRDSVEAPDIILVGSPHPTYLSMSERSKRGSATKIVERDLLAPLREEQRRGWNPPRPEPGLDSPFLKDEPYSYGRGFIPDSHGDPGITALRLLPVSTAQRAGSSTIVIGTRDRAKFDYKTRKSMEDDLPSDDSLTTSHEVLTGRTKFDDELFKFDRGPDEKYADLLFDSLDPETVFMVKDAYADDYERALEKEINYLKRKLKTEELDKEQVADAQAEAKRDIFDKHGIGAFYSKSHPDAGFFGHYRGTFDNPRVVVLADPHGYDSFITSKALTGARGQYLQGLMRDLGVDKDYLVISTVPVGMDGATNDEWDVMLERTTEYRENLLAAVLSQKPDLVIADGYGATQALTRILGSGKFIYINRGDEPDAGFHAAARYIAERLGVDEFEGISGERVDIPREHLTWIARVWEGTSGDRVITADPEDAANYGKAFAIVAPEWARYNEVHFSKGTRTGITNMLERLAEAGEPQPFENLSEYVERRSNCLSLTEFKERRQRTRAKPKCELTMPVTFPSGAVAN